MWIVWRYLDILVVGMVIELYDLQKGFVEQKSIFGVGGDKAGTFVYG